MMALEEKFDLELDEEKAESITDVQQAADLIAQQARLRYCLYMCSYHRMRSYHRMPDLKLFTLLRTSLLLA
jgi:hypothetical protein